MTCEVVRDYRDVACACAAARARRGRAAGTIDGTDLSMARADIWVVLTLIGWAGIDMSVSLPSLWLYIESLGGSKTLYGTAGAVANAVAFVAAPVFGWLADRFSSRGVIVIALVVQLAGGLLYSAAVLFPSPGGGAAGSSGSSSAAGGGGGVPWGAWVVVAARFLIGLASGSGATCRAYLTRNSDPAEKTANLGLAAAAWRIGPA
jgi:MFS family permease